LAAAAAAAAAVATAAGSAVNSSSTTTAPAASFLWEQFAVPGAEHANLIVVFRTKQLVQRFRPVCSHRGKKWAGFGQQQQQVVNQTTLDTAAAGAELAQGPCAGLLGSCRHLYRHAFSGEQLLANKLQLWHFGRCARATSLHLRHAASCLVCG
jgi:hypothetical protein